MAVIWMDGFDQYDDDNMVKTANGTNSGFDTVNLSEAGSRFPGGKALYMDSADDDVAIQILPLYETPPVDFAIGFAMRATYLSSDSNGEEFVAFGGILTSSQDVYPGIALMGLNNGNFFITDGVNSSAEFTPPVANAWHYYEIVYDDTAGTVAWWIDDTLFDTITYGSATPFEPRFFTGSSAIDAGGGGSRYVDDMYLATTRLGPCRVETQMPTGDGTFEDWATSNATIDAYTVVNLTDATWDAEYIVSATAGHKSTFVSSTPLESTPSTIHAVSIQAIAEQDNVTGKTWSVLAVDGIVEENSTIVAGFLPYQGHRLVMDVRPDGGGSWDKASTEALEFGVKLET